MRIVAAASLLFALAAQAQAQRNRPRVDPDSIKLEEFAFAEKSFQSKAIGGDSKFGIYLPKGYDDRDKAEVKWPLVLWLHGMFEDHVRFHVRGGAPVLDASVKDGKLPACIFVCANGGRTSMYVNRDDQRWEDLVTVDLLAHLQEHYRVSHRRDQRALMGVSMGGMAALRIALTSPDMFGAVAVHSAAVFPEDPAKLPDGIKSMASRIGLDEVFGNPIEKSKWEKANPLCLALATDNKKLHGLRIYFDAGTNDSYGFHAGNEMLHQALDKKDIDHTWRLIQDGGHSWGAGFQEQTLPFSFAAIGEMFKAAAARKEGLEGLEGAVGGKGDGKERGKE